MKSKYKTRLGTLCIYIAPIFLSIKIHFFLYDIDILFFYLRVLALDAKKQRRRLHKLVLWYIWTKELLREFRRNHHSTNFGTAPANCFAPNVHWILMRDKNNEKFFSCDRRAKLVALAEAGLFWSKDGHKRAPHFPVLQPRCFNRPQLVVVVCLWPSCVCSTH